MIARLESFARSSAERAEKDPPLDVGALRHYGCDVAGYEAMRVRAVAGSDQ